MRSKEIIASIAIVGAVATFAVLNMTNTANSSNFLSQIDKYEEDFNNFIIKHKRNIGTKEEYQYRLDLYRKNAQYIEEFNSQNGESFYLSLNKFADLSEREFKMMKGYKSGVQEHKKCPLGTSASALDWRSASLNPAKINAVSRVKNQGSCGSCWAFSAIGAIESRYAIDQASKTVLELSEQQLVDCDKGTGNEGCNGGDMGLAFDYVVDNGIDKESKYPYAGYDQKCKQTGQSDLKPIKNWCSVKPNCADCLKAALNYGPVSVAVEADRMPFQFYGGGILTSSACGTDLDHGILAVGYGTQSGQEYFIVKNSWGQGWGESGYIRIGNVATLEAKGGVCGILKEPVQPRTD